MVTIPTRDAYPTLRLSTSPMTASSPPIHVATLNV